MGRIFCLVGLLVVGLAAAFPAEAVYNPIDDGCCI